jgi:carbonic anhydrase
MRDGQRAPAVPAFDAARCGQYDEAFDATDEAPVDKFLAGYRVFREDYFTKHKAAITQLMTQRQSPMAMMIACSDSRIDPSLKFGADPGDMFMVRNVSALVPPYEPDGAYHGTSAALEFAVQVLEIPNIIIMGHARCGGIDALLRHQEEGATDFVTSWMQIARDALAQVDDNASAEDRQRMCEQAAVKVSLRNLMTFPWIASRVNTGKLRLHGWYFDLETATLHIMDGAGKFSPAPT